MNSIAIFFATLFCIFFLQVSSAKAEGASKMVVCMDAAIAAHNGFEMRKNNQKLAYPQIQNPIFRRIVHKSLRIGYNSETSQKAIQRAHDECVNDKFIWKEIATKVK